MALAVSQTGPVRAISQSRSPYSGSMIIAIVTGCSSMRLIAKLSIDDQLIDLDERPAPEHQECRQNECRVNDGQRDAEPKANMSPHPAEDKTVERELNKSYSDARR